MKNKFIYILAMCVFIIMPTFTNALEVEENNASEIVAQSVKYYKTIYSTLGMYDLNSLNFESNFQTIEITQEEYESVQNNQNIISATTETGYKKMTTTISTSGQNYRYQVDLEWKNNPKIRSYDVIAIGHYINVEPISAIKFQQKYCTSTTNCQTSTTGLIKTTSSGTGVVFKLPEGTYVTLNQTLYFDVGKKENIKISKQQASGDYAHAIKTINQSVATNFKVNINGIYFYDNSSSFDEIASAVANWSGVW